MKVIKLTCCKWCGGEFIKKSNREVCCDVYCKKEIRKEQVRKARLKHYKTYNKNEKIQTYSQYKKDLGTGSLSSRPNINFNIEIQLIRKEKMRLKIGG